MSLASRRPLAGVAFGEQTVTASLANNGASDNKLVHFIGDTAAAKLSS